MLRALLSDIRTITNDFCDLVLGPEPALESVLLGETIEVYADDPTLLDDYLEKRLAKQERDFVALLGVHGNRFAQKNRAGSLVVMPAQNALQLIFAASELLLSNAVDVIFIYEILLKHEQLDVVIDELRKLHRIVKNTNSRLVLLNPNTSERKRVATELEILCSSQIFIQ